MALLQDLIQQIEDPALRDRILQETNRLLKQKKFGLVFEEHLPECTPLYDVPIRIGSRVALKTGDASDIYTVLKIDGDSATCEYRKTRKQATFQMGQIVAVAEFGEAIYPTLELLDSIENAPDSDLWHTLIEADNYHALQLLEYLYTEKVDCIYIDPPYNSGAKDWKYNNDYVDSNDSYRHSKWLSMMQKRLKLAKKLLNPKDSVLIVTIDEKEYLHLGCLLEEMFLGAHIQMVSTVINPKGSARDGFSRSDEYIFFVMLGSSVPARLPLSNEWSSSALVASQERSADNTKKIAKIGWTSMMRRGTDSKRKDCPNLYYPIYVDPVSKRIKKIGLSITEEQDRAEEIPRLVQVLPLRKDGSQGRWQVGSVELENRIQQGRVRLGRATSYGFVINYLPDGEYAKVLKGEYEITGYADDGSIIVRKSNVSTDKLRMPPTQWKVASHNASENGTSLLTSVIGEKRFPFPKSLYAIRDSLQFFTTDKPNCIIIDFFAGSGTTLHAVNLLNAADGGQRRCIMVTNNEVSEDETKRLTKQGYQPGDEEWDRLGIARHVTWPRTVCSIKGCDVNGNPLQGNYFGSDLPMSEGFKANVSFFKLSFLDKTFVALGRQFKELLPVLWMKGGAIGKCPVLDSEELPNMLILPKNKMAILINKIYYLEFDDCLSKNPEIRTVFIVTNSESAYREMIRSYEGKDCYQLYRDYLDNFRINIRR